MREKNKKGFTLIELLAVIIILGILMLVAIPSVTRYITDSRKNAYVDTAKQYVKGATNLVNDGKMDMFDPDTTYYIPTSCIKLESGGDSPYGGKFDPAYVAVTYDNESYNYYWISVDEAGQGIDQITPLEKLDIDLIKSGIKSIDIRNTVETTGIGFRDKIKVLNDNDCNRFSNPVAASSYSSGAAQITKVNGNGKHIGDEVAIGNEHFYVVNPNDNGKTVLLAKYNLNVGDNKNPNATTGIQSSSVKGWDYNNPMYGNVRFASTNYWKNKIGTVYPGQVCFETIDTNCAYVEDENSNVHQYLVDYKKTLGIDGNVRLLKKEEAIALGCKSSTNLCKSSSYPWVYGTSYYLGSPITMDGIWMIIGGEGVLEGIGASNNRYNGVRPVVEIPN